MDKLYYYVQLQLYWGVNVYGHLPCFLLKYQLTNVASALNTVIVGASPHALINILISSSINIPLCPYQKPIQDHALKESINIHLCPNQTPLQDYALKESTPDSVFGSQDESDGNYRDYRSTSPSKAANASIDQLLSEIEREYYGPGYKYTPSTFSPSEEGEDQSLTNGTGVRLPAKVFLKSTRNGHISTDNYDILEPPGPTDSYDVLSPVSATDFKHHTYETLRPIAVEDGDTYVYMAPTRDFQRSGSLPELTSDR